jgi:hypothetical protein
MYTREKREKRGIRGKRLTVLKYSIDLMIFPFSSGTSNIPRASLALSSAPPPPTDIGHWSLGGRTGWQGRRNDIQLRSRSTRCSCYMDLPTSQFR